MLRAIPAIQTITNIWVYVQQVTKEIEGLSKGINDFLSKNYQQNKVISSLQKNPSIVIKPIDKEGNVVVMDGYIDDMFAILTDTAGELSEFMWLLGKKKHFKFNLKFTMSSSEHNILFWIIEVQEDGSLAMTHPGVTGFVWFLSPLCSSPTNLGNFE